MQTLLAGALEYGEKNSNGMFKIYGETPIRKNGLTPFFPWKSNS